MNKPLDLSALMASLPQSARGGEPDGRRSGIAPRSAVRRAAPAGMVGDTLTFDVFHWAAVSFVIAMTGGVLAYAAGTPWLAAVAHIFCYVFSIMAGALALVGWFARRDALAAAAGAREPAAGARAE